VLLHVQLDGSERVIALAEFEERVRDGTLGPETPVRSEPLTGDRWVPAGDLEIFRGIRASPEVRVRQALASAAVPWFTALLVGVEFRIFFWTQYTPVQAWLWDRFTKYTPAIVEGDQHWRLLSYGFLHGDAGHIGMNMLLIAYLGIALESVIGAFSLAVLFTSSVFWGGVLSALLAPDSPSVGASGGDGNSRFDQRGRPVPHQAAEKLALAVGVDRKLLDALPDGREAQGGVLGAGFCEQKLRHEARHQVEAGLERLALVDRQRAEDVLNLCSKLGFHAVPLWWWRRLP
jgi:hypothetical protein